MHLHVHVTNQKPLLLKKTAVVAAITMATHASVVKTAMPVNATKTENRVTVVKPDAAVANQMPTIKVRAVVVVITINGQFR